MTQIATLFASDINRQIEEVIKVDQTAEDIVAAEVDEYVVTDAIKQHFVEVFERYQETPQKPHEGIAVWVSGFFGSGKSSFAKMLGLTIENRSVLGEPVSEVREPGPRQEARRRPEGHQRADSDPHGHLRRLDRPRHPVR
jgi:2-phosphoglycerate kinase